MDAVQLLGQAYALSMAGLLLALALAADLSDIHAMLRRPSVLLRSLLALNVVMPLLALALALALDLTDAIALALVAMALAPVPLVLPLRALGPRGARASSIGLLVVSAGATILFVPALAELFVRAFDLPLDVPASGVASVVALWILLPLVIGASIRVVAPAFADWIVRPLAMAANVLPFVALVPLLVLAWPRMPELAVDFTLLAIVVFVLSGLAVGHALGGPDPDERAALGVSTAVRHPGLAMAVLQADPDPPAAFAAVLLVVVVGAIASLPYAAWRSRRHRHAKPAPESVPT